MKIAAILVCMLFVVSIFPSVVQSRFSPALTTISSLPNNPPKTPTKPDGPPSGSVGNSYTYSSSTTDPEDDRVYYLWDWGDGTNSGWNGPYTSGATVVASHTWTKIGRYKIQVQAKDDHNATSPWSPPLPITMPKNKATNSLFLQFLERLMQRFPLLAQLLHIPFFKICFRGV